LLSIAVKTARRHEGWRNVMRIIATAAICLLVMTTATSAAAAARLQVAYPNATIDATCALIDLAPGDGHTTLYFLTSAQPFRTVRGDPFPPPQSIVITLTDGETIVVPRAGVVLPLGSLVDIALLRVDVAIPPASPSLITFDAPPAGSRFRIDGYDRDGATASVAENARFVSTRYLIGDRDAAGLGGCLGAPAFFEGSLFGVVSDCGPQRAPTITLLSFVYPFLERHVPNLLVRPTLR